MVGKVSRGPFEIWRRGAITAFVVLHLSAVCWWLIPADGYPGNRRRATLPAWLSRLEQRVFDWKRAVSDRALPRLLERYTFSTATWQRWWLFAPSPMEAHSGIAVYAVEGWRDPARPAPKQKKRPWGDTRDPMYASEPLYRTHDGDLSGRKFVESVIRSEKVLASFASYWGRRYSEQHGKRPLGIHVLYTKARVDRPDADDDGDQGDQGNSSTRVVWYLHYAGKK
jgi:hypothetical protein